MGFKVGLALSVPLALFLLPVTLEASDFDIIINEINFNPFTGDESDEFVELYNRGPQAVDLDGWSFSEGISFTFSGKTILKPGEYLLVSPYASRARLLYGVDRVAGDYLGRLDNGGEIIALASARGVVVQRVHYQDGGAWPSTPDGLGPTLELISPRLQGDLPQSWAPSTTLNGTPGRRNSRFPEEQESSAILSPSDSFQTFKGTEEPSSPTTAWTQRSFDAPGWPEEPGPFGATGEYQYNTELDDMAGNYSTYYIRRTFDLDAATLADLQMGARGLALNMGYDDGFVAYLNGNEVGRANLGTPGVPVPHDAFASSRIEDGSASIEIRDPGILVETGNVLAIQGANGDGSLDFFLSVELILSPQASVEGGNRNGVVINEIRPPAGGGGAGFIELFNSGPAAIDIGGYFLVDSRGARFQIPDPLQLPAGNLLAFQDDQLGFPPDLADARYALVKRDGETWVDGINPSPGPVGASFGRYPDGNEDQFVLPTATLQDRNQLSLETAVVLNEILYHPVFVAAGGDCQRQCSDADQWIELHNKSGAEVDVSGWSLTKAVNFQIPGSTKIPGGGYLVIASDRQQFLDSHPGMDPARVVGDWTQNLGHASDTINLRDALGNRVDHVKYGDGDPTNDRDPDGPEGPQEPDGVDDRTFPPADWPKAADDGTAGRTLELVHPALDNRAGRAWRAGPPGGTPGEPNSTFDSDPAPVIWDVSNSPVVPGSTDPVQITCRVTSVAPVTEVKVLWHLEPNPNQVQELVLLDDGLSGDRAPGDGIYGGTIPPQEEGRIVGFQVQARAQDGQTALVPRSPGVSPYNGFQGPYFLYQVDSQPPPANGSVTYRILMSAADYDELQMRVEDSFLMWINDLLPCTFIADGKAYHNVGIRIRGESTRRDDPKPWRIEFPPERTFRDLERVNFVSQNLDSEILAADLIRRSGLPYMQEWTVNLMLQGNLELYAFKENFDGEFLQRYFGGSSGGNFYRALDPQPPGGSPQGDLEYYGEDPGDLMDYREVYDKRSNQEEDDYSDIIELCRAFDPGETPDEEFPDRLRELIDVDEWARFFALQAALSNNDGGIWSGTGEDYFLYHVPATSSRADAGKWILLPWDIDETFNNSSEQLFRPSKPSIRRFLRHFAPLYYEQILDLREGAFSRLECRQRFFLIDRFFGFSTIDGIDSYITARIGFFDERIPVALSSGITGASGDKFVSAGEEWKYFEGREEPSGGNRSWAGRTFDDSGPQWLSGNSGIGYGDGDDATVLDDMRYNYTTVYSRKKFIIPDPDLVPSLWLRVDYDDGFVAYLNGQEVARRNAPGGPGSFVPFDETASTDHEAGTPVDIDLSGFMDLLVAGDNVLAFQALNGTIDSSDLTLIPELSTGQGAAMGAGCGTVLFAAASNATLAGNANAAWTRSVLVDGKPASYDPYSASWSAPVSLEPGENTVLVEALDGNGNSIESREIEIYRLLRPFTTVGGTLAGNTTWSAAEGPYHLTQNVVVPAGARLTIEPGAFLLGDPGVSIIVRGALEARGTREDPILVRSASCQDRMGGIAFDNTGTDPADPEHLLRFVDLEFGHSPSGYSGTVAPVGSKLLVEDCTFRELQANAIDGTDSHLEVRRSLFEEIHEGVHCTRSTVVVLDSTFYRMVGDHDAIDFDYNGTGPSRIERCLFEYGSDDGIDLGNTTVEIRDNIFRHFSDKALSLEGNGPLGPPSVTGNLIQDSGTGMALKDGVTIEEGHHNTVVGCQEGIHLFPRATSQGGHGTFHSMILWDSISNVKLEGNSTVEFTHSNIGGGQWEGEGNISEDPLFALRSADDFSLSAGSPCIGTGKDGTDMGAVPYAIAFIRGDADKDQELTLTDAILALEYLFRSGQGPACLDRLDTNDDGFVDISDPIYLLFYLLGGGSPPSLPFPAPGGDPTPDGLECN